VTDVNTDDGVGDATTFALRMVVCWKKNDTTSEFDATLSEDMVRIFYDAAQADLSNTPKEEWLTAEAVKGIFLYTTSAGMRNGDVIYVGDNIINLADVSAMVVRVKKNLRKVPRA
jgi:hypothetical protein